jgi:RNA polymerase sigma-70 factor (ECF subfamily)
MDGAQSDEALVVRVAGGDARALETLCRRWERPLYAFLGRQTGGRDVDDLYQDTWLRVVAAAPRFDPSRRFSTWLFQIALNRCRDWRRRPPPEPVDPARVTAPAAPPDPADARLDARRLLAALPEAQRSAVILRYWHDCDEDEVARILRIPRGTVKSRLHHAMRRLIALARGARSPKSR